jgi:hypothetical protein
MKLGVGLVHETCIRGKLPSNVLARDLKHLFGRLDVVLISRKDRSLTLAQRSFIDAIAAEARPEHMDAAISRPRSQSHIRQSTEDGGDGQELEVSSIRTLRKRKE